MWCIFIVHWMHIPWKINCSSNYLLWKEIITNVSQYGKFHFSITLSWFSAPDNFSIAARANQAVEEIIYIHLVLDSLFGFAWLLPCCKSRNTFMCSNWNMVHIHLFTLIPSGSFLGMNRNVIHAEKRSVWRVPLQHQIDWKLSSLQIWFALSWMLLYFINC